MSLAMEICELLFASSQLRETDSQAGRWTTDAACCALTHLHEENIEEYQTFALIIDKKHFAATVLE